MAESIIEKQMYISTPPDNTNVRNITVDVSQYKNGSSETGGFAFLVCARSWAGTGFEQVGSIFLVSGLQNGTYQSCVAIKREHNSYAPNMSISGNNLTITFINTGGGFYTIVPLFNVN